MSHPRNDLDDALSTSLRFSLMAALSDGQEVAFQVLRDALETDDPALSKATTLLERVGYIEVRKGYVGRRPRTWLVATPDGVRAFQRHARALQRIASEAASIVPATVLGAATGRPEPV